MPDQTQPARDTIEVSHPGQERTFETMEIKKSPELTETPWEGQHEDFGASEYMSGAPLALVILNLCLGTFLVSLDRSIITVPIPEITAEFNSTPDIGWYGAAYSLTSCGFMPLYGRAYQSFNAKWTYLLSMGIFAVGSLLCAVCQNSVMLIVGRAIAGFGNAGVITGSMVIITHITALEKRAAYNSLVLMMFTVGTICGPLLGGVFTDRATWRWCFYVNLPVIGATCLAILLVFRPRPPLAALRPLATRILELDLAGNGLLLSTATMFFLALQYTSAGLNWGSARIIGLLVGSVVVFIAFLGWQWYKGSAALIPLNIVHKRGVAASCAMGFLVYGCLATQGYYLPIWFQAIKGDTAILSGVHMVPYSLAAAVSSILAAAFVTKSGYYTPPAILGCGLAAIGSGLLSTLAVDSSPGQWIGFQVLTAFGVAMSISQGYIAVDVALGRTESSIGLAAMLACQSLGAAIFIAVGNTLLQDTLLGASQNPELQGLNIPAIIAAGATQFRQIVPAAYLPALLEVYNNGLRKMFYTVTPLAALAVIPACFLGWTNLNTPKAVQDVSLSDLNVEES